MRLQAIEELCRGRSPEEDSQDRAPQQNGIFETASSLLSLSLESYSLLLLYCARPPSLDMSST